MGQKSGFWKFSKYSQKGPELVQIGHICSQPLDTCLYIFQQPNGFYSIADNCGIHLLGKILVSLIILISGRAYNSVKITVSSRIISSTYTCVLINVTKYACMSVALIGSHSFNWSSIRCTLKALTQQPIICMHFSSS